MTLRRFKGHLLESPGVLIRCVLALGLLSGSLAFSQVLPPDPVLPVPTENQLRWQRMEYYGFIHFSVNTYTDMAWGLGNEDPSIFNPEKLDCRQWARICKEAGMTGIIFTAKHHSGFCLWPSRYTEYSVKNSQWKNGKGDMVKELAEACREYGLKFGVYLSPWDRNHPDYGKSEYITYFRNQLTELLSNYGDIFEVWFDGANGGTGYYGGANEERKIDRRTYYDWPDTYALVRKLQPKIVIWNDGGDRADLRWVGTESGYVGETNWSLLNATGDVSEDMLRYGVENGNAWVPGEVNTSIRPEWFYHPKEDAKVKTLPQLMDTYYNSVGRNGTLLLNFPIMPNGLIHPKDEEVALEFARARQEAFGQNLVFKAKAIASEIRGNNSSYDAAKALDGDEQTYWATNDGTIDGMITIDLGKETSFNRFMVQEYIALGQRVKKFRLEAFVDGIWKSLAQETTIGYKRILRFPSIKSSKIRLVIEDSKSCPLISSIEVYDAPILITPPKISRNKEGDIHINAGDNASEIYYTMDGTAPSLTSEKYTGSVKTGTGKVQVKAVTYSPVSRKMSDFTEEKFEVSRNDWNIISSEDENRNRVLDGDENTSWSLHRNVPSELVIDLGSVLTLNGFQYLPDQHWWAENSIISEYEFAVSSDNKVWKNVSAGEFPNIKNNPVKQLISFQPVKARYIRFTAQKTLGENASPGIAELDLLTP